MEFLGQTNIGETDVDGAILFRRHVKPPRSLWETNRYVGDYSAAALIAVSNFMFVEIWLYAFSK